MFLVTAHFLGKGWMVPLTGFHHRFRCWDHSGDEIDLGKMFLYCFVFYYNASIFPTLIHMKLASYIINLNRVKPYTCIYSWRHDIIIGCCPRPLKISMTSVSVLQTCGVYFYGLVHDCSNSSALALELLQSCTKPSNYLMSVTFHRSKIKSAKDVH